MLLKDFDYILPEESIAQRPASKRTESRLMALSAVSDEPAHRRFHQLPELLTERDLLVFNRTRVMPARLMGHKASGGAVEVLIERIQNTHDALALVRASKSPRPGTRLYFGDPACEATVVGRQEDLFELTFERPVRECLAAVGHLPLPPYIQREPDENDQLRYQTVYAKEEGSVAAPTAGLHFDEALLSQLKEQGVQQAELILHVGAGTFQPVRVENVEEHEMHGEFIEVSASLCEQIAETRARGGRVIAVGTTTVRALEGTVAAKGSLQPYTGETQIFMSPGYQFQVVDALITNFHLPRSTLLMLVSALAGRERVLAAYKTAVEMGYRFYSYGDAMFLEAKHAV